MDFIWTIALLVGGYFAYNWYTGLQQQVKGGPDPDPRVRASPETDEAQRSVSGDTDYIDYEEVEK